jgi:ubiquitin-like 1-activating enzyme E1 A
MAQDTTNGEAITADEIALYDRQIRLWGVAAQESLRKANILLVSMRALANEVAKNLVLAGINSLTVIDHKNVTEDDLGAQFFISEADVGKNRAQAAAPSIQRLNNRVKVIIDTSDIHTKQHTYMQNYELVIATDLDFPTLSAINSACRQANTPFYAAGAHGFYGYIFADLMTHEYMVKSEPSNVEIKAGSKPNSNHTILSVQKKREDNKPWQIVEHRRVFSDINNANTSSLHPFIQSNRRRLKDVTFLLPCLRALWEFEQAFERSPAPIFNPDDLRIYTTLAMQKSQELGLPSENMKSELLRKFLQNVGSELPPVTAMLGGLLAQDAINVIQHCEAPINNLCLFDGESYKVPIYSLYPYSEATDVVANGFATKVTNGSSVRAKTPEGAIELD